VRILTLPALCAASALLTVPVARSQVAITVDASSPIRTVDGRFFGLNTAVWDGAYTEPRSMDALKELDVRFLRFPGGSTSDIYHWQTDSDDDQKVQWAIDFDTFAASAVTLDSQVVITVNYGTGTPEEAADWVAYSNKENGYGFKYWEIGNECYGSWEADKQALPHDPATYGTRAAAYIRAMKAVDPTIRIGVVGAMEEDADPKHPNPHPATNRRTGTAHDGWTPIVLSTLKAQGVLPDFLIYHRYDQAPGKEDDVFLLGSAKTWPRDVAALRQRLGDYLGDAGAGVEIVVTEDNQVYSDPGKQSTSLVNALFMADSVATVMQTEVGGLVWWDFHNGPLTTNNNSAGLYGWRPYGDYGVESPDHDRYPTFYAAKILSRFAKAGDTVVRATSSDEYLSAFSVRHADGTLSLLVINKRPTPASDIKVSLEGFVPKGTAVVAGYGIAEDRAAKTGSGSRDLSASMLSGVSNTFAHTFDPYSLTLLTFAAAPAP
jgi:hypothetical protein